MKIQFSKRLQPLIILFVSFLSYHQALSQEFQLMDWIGKSEVKFYKSNPKDTNVQPEPGKVITQYELTADGKGILVTNKSYEDAKEVNTVSLMYFHDYKKNETHGVNQDGRVVVTYPDKNSYEFRFYSFAGELLSVMRIKNVSDSERNGTVEIFQPDGSSIKVWGSSEKTKMK